MSAGECVLALRFVRTRKSPKVPSGRQEGACLRLHPTKHLGQTEASTAA